MVLNYTGLFRFNNLIKIMKSAQNSNYKTRSSKNSDCLSNLPIDLSAFRKSSKPKLTKNVNTQSETVTVEKGEVEIESSSSKRRNVKVEYENIPQEQNIKRTKNMPMHWEQVLANLKEMRKEANAPVDSMGCDKCHDENAPPNVVRYQQLLALMLSSQTKDQITHAAMKRLVDHGCTIENILNTDNEKLGELIYPVSFWKNKVKYIKKSTEVLLKDYNSDIPSNVEELCKLSGVGPKMAHICMETAWGQTTGIGVDTHVHRISNRLGWVNTNTPEETRKSLENWLPQELWSEVNLLLVGFGQQICGAVKPQCSTCLNNELCPFGKKTLRTGSKEKKPRK